MKYSYSDWNKRQGTVPVLWQKCDYEDRPWIQNHDQKGYHTEDKNYRIYKERLGLHILEYERQGEGIFIPDSMKKVFDYVPQFFDLDKLIYSFMKYPVGNVLPWHVDTYPTYCKKNQVNNIGSIVRVIIFLHDSTPGQQLWIDDKLCLGKAGSWFSWEGHTEHMAANLSKGPRYVMQITGVKPYKS